jgi:hypothetical protein
MGQIDHLTLVLSLALIVAVFGWVSSTVSLMQTMTGAATTSVSSETTVDIEKYFSINASGNLSAGIDFGTIDVLGVNNYNASFNYNDTGYPTENDGNETLYWITVETDSNTPVDLCIIASALNTSGGDEIGLGNYTFANNQTNNMTWPGPVDFYTMSTAYQKTDTNIAVGSSSYFRFWLDAPVSLPTGTYNNSVTILGRSVGVACP